MGAAAQTERPTIQSRNKLLLLLYAAGVDAFDMCQQQQPQQHSRSAGFASISSAFQQRRRRQQQQQQQLPVPVGLFSLAK